MEGQIGSFTNMLKLFKRKINYTVYVMESLDQSLTKHVDFKIYKEELLKLMLVFVNIP